MIGITYQMIPKSSDDLRFLAGSALAERQKPKKTGPFHRTALPEKPDCYSDYLL